MGHIRGKIDERYAEKRKPDAPKPPPFATGQSTQMLVGADASTDATILGCADKLYTAHRLKRVYYSAFSPIPEPSSILPLKAPPLIREHRLYQADWLLRFYDFKVEEIASAAAPNLDLGAGPEALLGATESRNVPCRYEQGSARDAAAHPWARSA